jgi:hypothetical protein
LLVNLPATTDPPSRTSASGQTIRRAIKLHSRRSSVFQSPGSDRPILIMMRRWLLGEDNRSCWGRTIGLAGARPSPGFNLPGAGFRVWQASLGRRAGRRRRGCLCLLSPIIAMGGGCRHRAAAVHCSSPVRASEPDPGGSLSPLREVDPTSRSRTHLRRYLDERNF